MIKKTSSKFPKEVAESLSVSVGLVVVSLVVVENNSRYRVDFGAERFCKINLALGLDVGHVNNDFVATACPFGLDLLSTAKPTTTRTYRDAAS